MLAAPIIAGNDLRSMTRETLDILTNKEAIAINQDKLGKQGYKILDQEYFEIFMKPLSDNDIAICLFNRGTTRQDIVVNWQDYKIPGDYTIRNIWKKSDAGLTNKPFRTSIDSHDVVLLRMTKR
jgi:alpha-galactosidase